MSGGGGGGGNNPGRGNGGRGGGRGGNSTTTCETLSITTTLLSPSPSVLAVLKPKDILSIQYSSIQGPFKVVTTSGAVAGALLLKDIIELINCIEQDYEYRVIVKSVIGGNCVVVIKP